MTPNLTATVEGFKVVPFPYLATLPPLPVANAYDGQTAWTVEWADDGSIVSATPNFRESGRRFWTSFSPRTRPSS